MRGRRGPVVARWTQELWVEQSYLSFFKISPQERKLSPVQFSINSAKGGIKHRHSNLIYVKSVCRMKYIVTEYKAWSRRQVFPRGQGGRRGLAVARWIQSKRSRVRYFSGATFIKKFTSLAQAVPGPI